MRIGDTVKLNNLEIEAYEEITEPPEMVTVTGEFTIEEFLPYEPSAYSHEDGVTLSTKDDSRTFYVGQETLWQHIDPKSYEQAQAELREAQAELYAIFESNELNRAYEDDIPF